MLYIKLRPIIDGYKMQGSLLCEDCILLVFSDSPGNWPLNQCVSCWNICDTAMYGYCIETIVAMNNTCTYFRCIISQWTSRLKNVHIVIRINTYLSNIQFMQKFKGLLHIWIILIYTEIVLLCTICTKLVYSMNCHVMACFLLW